MKRRCPHCQTTPLRADADTCWYCGKDYGPRRQLRRVTHAHAPDAPLRRRRMDSKASSPPAAAR